MFEQEIHLQLFDAVDFCLPILLLLLFLLLLLLLHLLRCPSSSLRPSPSPLDKQTVDDNGSVQCTGLRTRWVVLTCRESWFHAKESDASNSQQGIRR